MKTATMTRKEIETRIAALESTPRALVGSDSGTHGKPDRFDIYEEITGERYAVYSFGGDNGSRCPEAEARAETKGRIRHFPNSQGDIREKQAELKRLRRELQKCS